MGHPTRLPEAVSQMERLEIFDIYFIRAEGSISRPICMKGIKSACNYIMGTPYPTACGGGDDLQKNTAEGKFLSIF